MNFLVSVPTLVLCGCLYLFPAGKALNTTHPLSPQEDSTYAGPASLAYNIGARKVSIKSFVKTKGQYIIALFSNDVIHNDKEGMVQINVTNSLTHEVFNLNVADKGETIVKNYSPGPPSPRVKEAVYMSPAYQNYYGLTVTVTIISADAKKVTGTFSGQFKNEDGQVLTISAGHFDLPFTAPR